jgi:hypothetical protein
MHAPTVCSKSFALTKQKETKMDASTTTSSEAFVFTNEERVHVDRVIAANQAIVERMVRVCRASCSDRVKLLYSRHPYRERIWAYMQAKKHLRKEAMVALNEERKTRSRELYETLSLEEINLTFVRLQQDTTRLEQMYDQQNKFCFNWGTGEGGQTLQQVIQVFIALVLGDAFFDDELQGSHSWIVHEVVRLERLIPIYLKESQADKDLQKVLRVDIIRRFICIAMLLPDLLLCKWKAMKRLEDSSIDQQQQQQQQLEINCEVDSPPRKRSLSSLGDSQKSMRMDGRESSGTIDLPPLQKLPESETIRGDMKNKLVFYGPPRSTRQTTLDNLKTIARKCMNLAKRKSSHGYQQL